MMFGNLRSPTRYLEKRLTRELRVEVIVLSFLINYKSKNDECAPANLAQRLRRLRARRQRYDQPY